MSKLEYFKKKVLSILDSQEKAGAQDFKKSFAYIVDVVAKGNFPVGTIREWKGKKYIKVAPGKWRPKYDSNSRGAKLSIAALKRKAENCKTSQELLQLVLENRDRFSDKDGKPLAFVKELSDYVSGLNDNIEKQVDKKTQAKTQEKKRLAGSSSDDAQKQTGKKSKKQVLIDHVKHLTNIDLSPYVDDEHSKRKYLNVFWNKIPENDQNAIRRIAHQYGMFSLEQNGYSRMALFYGDKLQDSKVHSNDVYPEKDYPEYKGKGQKAVDFIVKQKGGQVRGAFNRPEIGDIDVVWGKVTNADKHEGYGLAHIIDKHGMDAARVIGEVIEYGKAVTPTQGRISIQLGYWKVALKQQFNGNKKIWIVTSFKNEDRGQTTTPSPQSDYTKGTDSETSTISIPQSGKKSSEITQIRNKYESTQSITGNKKTVTLPNGTKIKCHYKLVEAESPTASHDENTYSPTPGFPSSQDGKTVNDRDYYNDKDAQESVRKIAAHFNSLALESPPIVTKDGVVISGNNRTMSSKLAAKNGTDTAYMADLKELIDEYGLKESDLADFKHPRLILEMDAEHEGDYTTEEFAQFNRDTKKTMSNVEKAVKITKTLNEGKIQSIASQLSAYETMGALYADAKGCQYFVTKLIDAGIIGDNEKAQYLKSDGTLNDTGKDFTETVLVGTILNEDNIRRLDRAGGKRIRQKLVRAILPLVENKGTGKEYSFNKELNEAVDIAVSVAKNHEKYPDVETYLAQGTLFGEAKPDEITGKLAKLIHDEGEKAFATRMKNLGAGLKHSADGEMDIFLGGVETKQNLMERFLAIQKSIADILTNLYNKERTIRNIVAEALQNSVL